MTPRLPESLIRGVKPAFDRKHLVELIMTLGVIGMTFFLVALILMRLTSGAETTEPQAEKKPEPQPPIAMTHHNEIELGRFSVTPTPVQNLSTGKSRGKPSVLQFEASVMVQHGNRSKRVEDAFGRYRNRLNAAVDAVTRRATPTDLRDPELRHLRGEIRSNVNQLLGANVVDEVIVSDFRHFKLEN